MLSRHFFFLYWIKRPWWCRDSVTCRDVVVVVGFRKGLKTIGSDHVIRECQAVSATSETAETGITRTGEKQKFSATIAINAKIEHSNQGVHLFRDDGWCSLFNSGENRPSKVSAYTISLVLRS